MAYKEIELDKNGARALANALGAANSAVLKNKKKPAKKNPVKK